MLLLPDIKKISQKKIPLIISCSVIFILSLAGIIGLFDNFLSFEKLEGDPPGYMLGAYDWYHFLKPNELRPIGISTLIGFPYLFIDSQIFVYRWFLSLQIIFWILSPIVMYKILRNMINEYLAFVFSILSIFTFSAVILTFYVMSEISFIFFILLSIQFYIKYFKHRKIKNLYVALLLMFFSVLIRPGFFIFTILFFLFLLIYLFQNKTLSFIRIGVIFLIFFSTIGLQVFQMKKNFNSLSLSNAMEYGLWMISSHARSIETKRTIQEEQILWWKECENSSLEGNENIKEIVRLKFKKQFISSPNLFFEAYYNNLISNVLSGTTFIKNQTTKESILLVVRDVIYKISVLQNVIYSFTLFLISLYMALLVFKNRISDMILSAKFLFLFFSISAGLYIYSSSAIMYWQGDRYHVTAYPFILIAFALIYDNIIINKKHHKALYNWNADQI